MIIITGAIGTGKSLVANAIANAHPTMFDVHEAVSKQDALETIESRKADSKELIVVCQAGQEIYPIDVFTSGPAAKQGWIYTIRTDRHSSPC